MDLKPKVYLAGYAYAFEYRDYVKENYSEYFNLHDPIYEEDLSVPFEQLDYEKIVNKDKKAILSSDIFVAYIGEKGCTFGTAMEIIFAHSNGKPVYIIDETGKYKHDVWLKYHTTKYPFFENINECFKYILEVNKDARIIF
jgi:nucleoside 2-deoxyribosyltransferase